MEELKKFFPICKKYIQYLLKLGFKEFFKNVIEIILLALLSCLVYLPIDMIRILLDKLLFLFTKTDAFNNITDLIFAIISACTAIYVFVRFFNIRYSNIEEIRKDRKEIMYKKNDDKSFEEKKKDNDKEDIERRERAMEEFELPKEFEVKNKK